MPLYEYKCHRCSHVFEVIQKFSDSPLAVHEECGGVLERLISPSAFQFKGSGWYVTDYAGNGKGGNSSKADKDGKPETKTDAKPDSKTESKSESKSESKPAPSAAAEK